MFGENFDLAESKLLILYIFSRIKKPLANFEITELVLSSTLMNYFSLQIYLRDMIKSKLIIEEPNEDKVKLNIAKDGVLVLDLFSKRIPDNKKEAIDNYLQGKYDISK
ncbi:MAG TPA: DUF4364 family protein [Clostridiaceae bacterium]